jgi:hypothetical protein
VGRKVKHQVKHPLKKLPKLHKSETLKKSRFSRANLAIFAVIFVAIGGYLLYQSRAAVTCTSTLSSGASVSSALSSAVAGSTICLNAGTYSFTTGTINKSSMTTVIAAPGVTRDQAIINGGINLQASRNITFQTMTINGITTLGWPGSGPGATNITLTDISFPSTSSGVCLFVGDDNTNRGILISYSAFVNTGRACGEARLQLNAWGGAGGAQQTKSWDHGIVIDHNLFQGPGASASNCSDGIQGAGSATGYTVSNNTFRWIDQHPLNHGTANFDCPDNTGHFDPFQPYDSDYIRIYNNLFDDNTTGLLNADCAATHTDVQSNVWINNGEYGNPVIIAGGSSDSTFSHNVVTNGSLSTHGNSCDGFAGTFTNNVLTGGFYDYGAGGTGTGVAPSNPDYNLTTTAVLRGPHGISASPIFVGGNLTPGGSNTTWDNFALASNSPGYLAGGDGKSMGIVVSGTITPPPTPTPPPPPTDPTPPTVSLTAPSAGATVSGASVTLSANAADNVGVSGVQFKIDGSNAGSEDTTSPYSTTWNSITVPNGTHSVTATARDAAGNSTTSSSVSITVANTGNFTIGETTITPIDDNGNANLLLAQQATLGQSATIQSLSFYVTTAAGKLRLGIYDATGPSGGPGVKKAETAEMTPVVGWNTASVTTPVSLPAGNYWLAYLPNDNNLAFKKVDTSSAPSRLYSFTYGTLPNTYSTTPQTTPSHWSFYATLSLVSTGPKQGDINGDNSVNITDLSLLLSSYGQNITQCVTNTAYKCDLSSPGDGIVNIFDLSILLSHYGS